jgi:hypothetical protein
MPSSVKASGWMSRQRVIGSHVKIALNDLQSAGKLGFSDRNTAQMLFQAAENLTMAALTSEGVDVGMVRRSVGNHQLGVMIAALPDACVIKADLEAVSVLEIYPPRIAIRVPPVVFRKRPIQRKPGSGSRR